VQISIVFPHQLFRENPCLDVSREVLLIEDPLYFTQLRFHKQKLILHRASMQAYAARLKALGNRVRYIPHDAYPGLRELLLALAGEGVKAVHCTEPTDYLLERRLRRCTARHDMALHCYANPNFLTDRQALHDLLGRDRRYVMAHFYMKQRRRLGLLMENGKPVGGRWSFDSDNRKRLPRQHNPPSPWVPPETAWVQEARAYVARHFPDHYGTGTDFSWPVTHAQAEQVLIDFLQHRLHSFGDYEDAISRQQSTIYHSLLTPALNIGLLSPQQVLERVLETTRGQSVPLNSLEGFIRQIIGWREFMRGIYELEGVYLRTCNYFAHERRLPGSLWSGNTGIAPLDTVIRRVMETGWCHHIERLMILSNFMLLCEFHPDAVYEWFMALFVDAYDWVMVPNVYGMGQYADGGLITSKPYVSGSNYLLKMSDFRRDAWCQLWDALYWRWIWKNRRTFREHPRMGMMVRAVERMDATRRAALLATADDFLGSLS
jgi:deoxyribodipyrimidine photolyase-related protein